VSDDEPYYDGVHPYPVARPKTDADRSQIAKIAANTRWAHEEDRSAATQPARDGMYRKFEDEVDPERKLPPEERAKRVENARRAYYQQLARKSAQARRAKKGGGG
jgi:hypothetical protein